MAVANPKSINFSRSCAGDAKTQFSSLKPLQADYGARQLNVPVHHAHAMDVAYGRGHLLHQHCDARLAP